MGSHLLLKGVRASGSVVRGSRGLAVRAVAALLEVSCMSQRVSLCEGLSQGRTPSGREEGGTWKPAWGSGGDPWPSPQFQVTPAHSCALKPTGVTSLT